MVKSGKDLVYNIDYSKKTPKELKEIYSNISDRLNCLIRNAKLLRVPKKEYMQNFMIKDCIKNLSIIKALLTLDKWEKETVQQIVAINEAIMEAKH